jgi:non-heme chloroperoxidase
VEAIPEAAMSLIEGRFQQFSDRRRTVVTNDGAGLSVIEAGDGRPFVILPAWTNAACEYGPQIENLARDHRVFAVDMRGHGESEKAAHGYRVSRLAADLNDVLTALNLGDVVLMGHSMGCSVIWGYLDLYGPARVGALVLVDQAATQLIQPWWSAEERLAFGCGQTPEELFAMCASLAGPDGERFTDELFTGVFTASFPKSVVQAVVREVLKMPRRHAAELMLDHATRDWRDVIATIRLPTLVVGAEASVFPAESQQWIARQIPGAEVEIFEASDGGSHFMCLENPARFNARVRAFLDH